MPDFDNEKFYTIQEFADKMHVHRVTVSKWIAAGKINVLRTSGKGHVRIPYSEFERIYTGNKTTE